jgi:cysteinyl-tRNA synthetase
MLLFNTKTHQKETLVARDGRVSLYVCGITPYDVTHLGHAFSYVFYDTLRRYLLSQGLDVTYVQNVTDVDDDVIRKAAELGEPVEHVVEVNVADFDRDMRDLNVLPPTHYPRATGQIDRILTIVRRLLDSGHAYTRGGDVFFRASTFPDFGRLSGRSGDDLISDTEPKRLRERMQDSHDFTLWQESLPGEPHWTSPWGEGRPGWHIECAAMASEFAGIPVDIHGGGSDLIFPHHESEIAQAESFSGRAPFVRYWVHVGMLRIDGEKMSKSLKNLVLVSDLLRRYDAATIRAYLLATHYRAEPHYQQEDLAAWSPRIQQIRQAVAAQGAPGALLDPSPYLIRFNAALGNDMDTPHALAILGELASVILGGASRLATGEASRALRDAAAVLGLNVEASGDRR